MMKRYKVIADYPGSHYDIGQVIYENDGRTEYDAPNHFEDYPAIFEEIQWHEGLSEDDLKHLPEYIMIDPEIELERPFVVFKIIKWELENEELVATNYKKEKMSNNSLRLYLPSNKIEFAKYIREWNQYIKKDEW